jgi:PIN domain nuclease of toxin-antitoxin system
MDNPKLETNSMSGYTSNEDKICLGTNLIISEYTLTADKHWLRTNTTSELTIAD